MKSLFRFLALALVAISAATNLQSLGSVCFGQDVAQLQAEINRFEQLIDAENYEQAERHAQYVLGLADARYEISRRSWRASTA